MVQAISSIHTIDIQHAAGRDVDPHHHIHLRAPSARLSPGGRPNCHAGNGLRESSGTCVSRGTPIARRGTERSGVAGVNAMDGGEAFGPSMPRKKSRLSDDRTLDASRSSGAVEYTILMTFRGCPEGFDPATGDFYAECTIPLDAPDAAVIVWGGDGQGGMSITQLGRQDDGTYVYTSSQASGVTLSGLAPVLRDAYQVFDSDGGDGSTYTVHPAPGEVRQVTIYYYYAP